MNRQILRFGILVVAMLAFAGWQINNYLQQPTLLKQSKNAVLLQKIQGEEEERKHARFDHPAEAMREMMAMRSEIGKPFPYKGNWRFAAQRQALVKNSLRKSAGALNWIERGPGNVGGRTRVVVVHPDSQDVWWAGAVGGGIWHTSDRGQTWNCQSDNLPVLSVCTMDICRNQPNVLYAGTGEGFYNYDAIPGDGIFKTTDGGATWQQLAFTAGNSDFRYVNRLIVHPQHPDTLLAATRKGVFRSLDGGENWQKVFSRGYSAHQIVANPQNFNSLFVCIYNMGIYKSVDMGENWQLVSEEFTDPNRIEMAVSAADTNYVYAAVVGDDSGLRGFFKSKDGGINWINLGNSINWLGQQGWYDNTLTVSPFDPELVYVGGIDLYTVDTHNDAFTATEISQWYGGYGFPYVHADQHCIVTLPRPDSTFAVIATNDGGVFYSEDEGVSWTPRISGYNVTQFYDADRHPYWNQFIGGTQDNGTNLSMDNPKASSSWEDVIGGDGFDCAWDKSNPDIVYGTLYYTRIFKSVSGGEYFREMNNGLPQSSLFHTPLAMDPHNSQKLFTCGDGDYLYYTRDGAESWNTVDVTFGGGYYRKIAVSEKSSQIVWAATTSNYINVSQDSGYTFSVVPMPDTAPLSGYVTGFATSPLDSATALVLFGVYGYGKVFRTHDLGQSWQDLTADLPDVPVNCGLIMPYDSAEIWLGTDIGLFISTDDGQSWQYANQNLPAVSIARLKIVGQEIVAATHGRGIWSVHNDRLHTQNYPTKEPLLADLFPPNPNTNMMKIYFNPQGVYDSIHVNINDHVAKTLVNVAAYQDTFVTMPVEPPDFLEVRIVGYKDTLVYNSEAKSQTIYEAVDSVTISFNGGSSDFSGDFIISKEDGFNTPTLHTEHPYKDQNEYIALLKTPIIVADSMVLRYRDVAIVEPGETGYYYPQDQMWDYVTVEGSADGEHWDILVTPYDSRINSDWKFFFENDVAPDEFAFVEHDTSISDFYSATQKIYIRFRLYADAAAHGWGWAIDDVFIGKPVSTGIGAERITATQFALWSNYPNPFNPSTTIRFTLARNGPVSLKIFDNRGRLVRTLINNTNLSSGKVHSVVWNGKNNWGASAATGIYYYQLHSGKQRAVRKMLLLK